MRSNKGSHNNNNAKIQISLVSVILIQTGGIF